MNQRNDNTNTDKTQALMKSGKAAEFLGIGHRTFKRLVKAGKVCPDFVSDGGHNFFSKTRKTGQKLAMKTSKTRKTGQKLAMKPSKTRKTGQKLAMKLHWFRLQPKLL